jgi:hypothetical protein
MNKIGIFLKTPFSPLSIEEKLEMKKLIAHQPRGFELQQKSWLTVRKKNHSSVLGEFCLEAKLIRLCQAPKI